VKRPLRVAALSVCVIVSAGGLASAELIQDGNLRISFDGRISPKRLPRHGAAPVTVSMSADLTTTDGSPPPQLATMTLDINRHGRLNAAGLPVCKAGKLAYATTEEALRACRPALVGRGHLSAKIALPEQAPFPSEGVLLAFNARRHGRPVILGHIYGAEPLAITLVIPFAIRRIGGRFGTRLTATFPQVAADWGYLTHFEMTLGRRYSAGGRRLSYLSASCPTPKGVNRALFTMARGSYGFDDGRVLESSLVRECRVRGK
jgi:hypothetical protein